VDYYSKYSDFFLGRSCITIQWRVYTYEYQSAFPGPGGGAKCHASYCSMLTLGVIFLGVGFG